MHFLAPSKNEEKKKKIKRFGNNIILQHKLWAVVQTEYKKEKSEMLFKFMSCVIFLLLLNSTENKVHYNREGLLW